MNRIIALALALLMLLVSGCGAVPGTPDNSAPPQTETPTSENNEDLEEDEMVEPVIDNVKPISIVNDTHSDKVITEPNFTIPEDLEDGSDTFILSPIISSGMILQANMPVRLWGACLTDGGVAARITNSETGDTRVFYGNVKDGNFEIYLGPTNYGGPYTIELISSDGKSVTLDDVLFGEVYLCGGQSNMGWFMSQCYKGDIYTLLYQDIIDNSYNDNIRSFLVYPKNSEEPIDELAANSATGWKSMSPSTVPNVSAVAYFFARELNAHYNIPIGIVISCMGGTSIYTWFPPSDAQSLNIDSSNTPSIWYNAMINPLRKLTVRGTIWYQGEGHCDGYAEYLKAMIEAWRREFETPQMYFGIVQLPRYRDELTWFLCREEDKKVCSMADNATYSVNIDTGLYPEHKAEGDKLNDDGIHPYDKEPVGTRLANAIMEKFYGAEGVWRGPVLKSAKLVNGQVKLTFDNVGSGLALTGELAGFELCGADGKYYDAVPKLVSAKSVVLECESVADPVKVRYGYKNYSSLITKPITSCAQSVSLYNTKGTDKKIAYPAEQFWVDIEK